MSRSNHEEYGTSYAYRNDFLYFVLKPDKNRGKQTFIYCSGVNVSRFSPLTTGRYGIGSNPAMRGLQLVNLGVRDLALSRGATPRALRENECRGMAPTKEDWYTERLLLENLPVSFPEEMFSYCAIHLLEKIVKACMLQDVELPAKLPGPDEFQILIETLSRRYGR